jgi:hypothetical protein
VLFGMFIVTFLYLSVFIKVYIIPEREDITFTLLSPIAVAPTILVYGCEMISECQKHCANWSKKHQHMNKMIGVVKTSNNENLTDE